MYPCDTVHLADIVIMHYHKTVHFALLVFDFEFYEKRLGVKMNVLSEI